jgi:Domain of unknown function (DUF6265)
LASSRIRTSSRVRCPDAGAGERSRGAQTDEHDSPPSPDGRHVARDDSGRLSFFAQPRGVAPAGFPAIRTTPTEVAFENPAHDFPQRIVYRFEAPATLRAHIEGTIDGKTRREDFHFVRGSCESN